MFGASPLFTKMGPSFERSVPFFLQSFLKFFLAVAFISRHAGIFLSLYIGSLENINKVLVCIGFMLLGCAQSTLCGERAISATQKRPVP